jgi:hypothetical protein
MIGVLRVSAGASGRLSYFLTMVRAGRGGVVISARVLKAGEQADDLT